MHTDNSDVMYPVHELWNQRGAASTASLSLAVALKIKSITTV